MLVNTALTAQININTISSGLQPANVLRFDISCQTSVTAKVFARFGYWNGMDSVWNTTSVSASGSNHDLTLTGLLPTTNYACRLIAFNGTGYDSTGTTTFTSGAISPIAGIAKMDSTWDSGANLPGFILTNTAASNPERMMQVFDRQGNVIWYDSMPGIPSGSADSLFQAVNLSNRNTLLMLEGDRLIEADWTGKILRDISISGIDPDLYLNQDVFINSAGNYVALTVTPDTVDKSGVGGPSDALVINPGYIVLDTNGNEVNRWTASGHYNPVQSPAAGGHWAPRFGSNAIDWMHVNSISQDADGHYMASFSRSGKVIKTDKTSGFVYWEAGVGGDFFFQPHDVFTGQHSIRVMDDNDYIFFDNTGLDSLSRVMRWFIDWDYIDIYFVNTWEYILPQQYFNPGYGHVQATDSGTVVISASAQGGIFETDPSGGLAWFGKMDRAMDRAFRFDDFYNRETVSYSGRTYFCLVDTSYVLQGQPSGGWWEGAGVAGGVFNPVNAGAGSHVLNYHYGDDVLPVNVNVNADTACTMGIQIKGSTDFSFSVFPNPFDHEFEVSLDINKKTDLLIQIISTDGKIVKEIRTGTLVPGKHAVHFKDLDQISEGIYLVKINDNRGNGSHRLIIKAGH